MRRSPLLIALPLLAGCTDYLGPDVGDPADFVLAEPVMFSCGFWSPGRPEEAVGLFDIRFGDREGDRGPEERHIRAVLAAGGTVVHRFNVAKARVVAPIDAIAKLGGTVRGVTDPNDFRVGVFVGFRGEARPDVVRKYGGYVEKVYSTLSAVKAVVHDRMIPKLRGDPQVLHVESSEDMICYDADAQLAVPNPA